jgi:hypothetical protein
MVLNGLGDRVTDLKCPECGNRLATIYGYARCTNCDFISKYSRDEQIAPEATAGGLVGLLRRKKTRRKFEWDQPLNFATIRHKGSPEMAEVMEEESTEFPAELPDLAEIMGGEDPGIAEAMEE